MAGQELAGLLPPCALPRCVALADTHQSLCVLIYGGLF